MRQTLAGIWNEFLNTFQFSRKQAELDQELAFHIDGRAHEFEAQGHSPQLARKLAMQEFGGIDRCREECRDAWGTRVFANLIRDIRFSARSLRRSPAYGLTVIGTIALCIGANTTTYTALRSLFLKPPPFHDPEQLVEIYNSLPLIGQPKRPVSIHQYRDFLEEADTFQDLAMWRPWSFNIGEDTEATRGVGARVTANYFELLGVNPLLGSFFTEDDALSGRDNRVVLTQTHWESRYAADPAIAGKQIRVDGLPFTVVGVAPRRLEAMNANTIMLRPYPWTQVEASEQQHYRFSSKLYGRLKPEASLQSAHVQLNEIENRFIENAPNRKSLIAMQETADHTIELGTVRAVQTQDIRQALLILQVTAALVLLLACANIANLTLARFHSRYPEFSIRLALGANWKALIRQLFVEGLMLALVASVIGLALAYFVLAGLNLSSKTIIREAPPIALDATVVWTILLVAVLIAVLGNLAAALRLCRFRAPVSARSSTRNSSARSTAAVLVTTQFAIATVVLVGASLLARSFIELTEVDPGFDATRVVYGRTAKSSSYSEQEWLSKRERILDEMRSIPGVEGVSFSSHSPVTKSLSQRQYPIRGETYKHPNEFPLAYSLGVSPSYFRTMGIPFLEGRSFQDSDYEPGARPVYIVDETFARKHFPRGAVGQSFDFGERNLAVADWPTIIGVVRPVLAKGLDDQSGLPMVYSLAWKNDPGLSFELRTALPPAASLPLMRAALTRVDPSLPIYDQGSVQLLLDQTTADRRVLMTFITCFGAISLLLSAVGVYGMLSYDVVQRTKEIGIRGAIGAKRSQIIGLFIRQGMAKAIIGLAIGAVVAYSAGRYTSAFLFKIEPTDTISYVLAALVLLAVALIASWLPARRAANLAPLTSLRID